MPNADKGAKASSPSHQRKQSKRIEEERATEESAAVKASKLWTRRSRQKSLELKVPPKGGVLTEGMGDFSQEERTAASVEIVNGEGKSPATKRKQDKQAAKAKKQGKEVGDEVSNDTLEVPGSSDGETKLRANSDSSNTSDKVLLGRASMPAAVPRRVQATHSNHLPNYQSTSDSSQAQNASTPKSSSSNRRAFSLANTVGAMNALRKMVGHRDSDGDHKSHTSDDEDNTARRRWRMIFNVSKFENIVRAPQVPERVDESLFYTSNIKHQGRLVSTRLFSFRMKQRHSFPLPYATIMGGTTSRQMRANFLLIHALTSNIPLSKKKHSFYFDVFNSTMALCVYLWSLRRNLHLVRDNNLREDEIKLIG